MQRPFLFKVGYAEDFIFNGKVCKALSYLGNVCTGLFIFKVTYEEAIHIRKILQAEAFNIQGNVCIGLSYSRYCKQRPLIFKVLYVEAFHIQGIASKDL